MRLLKARGAVDDWFVNKLKRSGTFCTQFCWFILTLFCHDLSFWLWRCVERRFGRQVLNLWLSAAGAQPGVFRWLFAAGRALGTGQVWLSWAAVAPQNLFVADFKRIDAFGAQLYQAVLIGSLFWWFGWRLIGRAWRWVRAFWTSPRFCRRYFSGGFVGAGAMDISKTLNAAENNEEIRK